MPPRNNSKSIAVIGGGFTGMVAARQLAVQGHRVTIHESSPDLGGLAASFKIAGEPLEKAYHHLFRTDHEILGLVDELDLHEALEWRPSSVAIFRHGKVWPFMTPLDLMRFTPCSWSGRLRTGLAALYLKHTRRWRRFVHATAMGWMRRACGRSASAAIWDPLLRGKFSLHAEQVSMAWMWARLHVRSNSRQPGESRENLGYFKGGFVRVVDALERDLTGRGVVIRKKSAVKRLAPDGAGTMVVTDDGEARHDAVLFTGSNSALARLLPADCGLADYREKLRGISYLGAVCHVFSTPQSLSDQYWLNVNEDKAPFLVLIQHTNFVEKERYGGLHVYYIGAYLPQVEGRFVMGDEPLINEWHHYLQLMFPAFDPSLIRESHLFRFRDAQHVVGCDYESRILPYETPLPGLFLANFSQIFPEDRGTNFSVREGRRVADRIMAHLASA